jgi:hypothetical protein
LVSGIHDGGSVQCEAEDASSTETQTVDKQEQEDVEEDINVVDFEIYAEGKKQMIGSRGMA